MTGIGVQLDSGETLLHKLIQFFAMELIAEYIPETYALSAGVA